MPNRAERRRAARAHAKQPVIIAGDGLVATELPGHQFEAVGSAQLPTKIPGNHRWVATVAYVLNDLQARDAYDASVQKFLDHENLMYAAIGCWDCEKALPEVGHDSTCPAPGDDA